MKQKYVLERVYEPRRLLFAWLQVKRNAGVAGIDQMKVKEFERRKRELNGGHAEKLVIPALNCMKMPDSMRFALGALSIKKA